MATDRNASGIRRWVAVAVLSQLALLGQVTDAHVNTEEPFRRPPAAPQDTAAVEGRVVDSVTGEPVKKATVRLEPLFAQPEQRMGSTVTNAGGSFRIINIPPGVYRLTAVRTGYLPTQYGAPRPNSPGTLLKLTPKQALSQISITLTPHGVIAGRVLNEDGEPVASAHVQALMHRYMQGKRTLAPAGGASTNDLGEYRLFGLLPGRYYISAMLGEGRVMDPDPDDQDVHLTTYYPSSSDAASATAVPVSAGRAVTNVEVRLIRTRAVKVSGAVINGGAGPQTMVQVIPRSGGGILSFDGRSALVRSDGTFELSGVVPGSYWLVAQEQTGGAKRLSGRTELDVGAADVDNVTVAMHAPVDIPVEIKVEGSNEQLDGMVDLNPVDNTGINGGAHLRLDGQNRPLQGVLPDRYVVRVSGLGQNAYLKTVQLGSEISPNFAVTVGPSSLPLLLTVSKAGGQVNGSVLDAHKMPAHATVVLVPDAPRRDWQPFYKVTVTAENGTFSMKGIPPGDYKLFAWEYIEDGAWLDPDFLKPYENRGRSLSIRENAKESVQLEMLAEVER